MQKTAKENTVHEHDDLGLYEAGFLILSTTPEDKVSEEASAISEIITRNGGKVMTTEGPTLRGLAYTMTKHVSGKNIPHDTAYFGSIYFDAPATIITSIEKEIGNLPNVLRSLVIETAPEALLPRERKVMGKIEPEKFRPEKPATPVAPVSEEELDKTIEELVVQ
jgi:ribosomal protein S6